MIMVDQGPMIKRFRPAPQGRAHRIRKHSNHVTLAVTNAVAVASEAEGSTTSTEETTNPA